MFLYLENRSGDKELVPTINAEKEKSEIWTIYYKEFASASPEKQPEMQWRMAQWEKLMEQGLNPREAYRTSKLLDFDTYLRKEYDENS